LDAPVAYYEGEANMGAVKGTAVVLGGRACALLAAAAGLAVSGNALAQTAVFSNNCGTGTWGGVCAQGGGIYSSNWGRTGPNIPALLPGPSDTCLLAGTVTLDVDATVSTLTVPAGAAFIWPYGVLNVGSMSNNGEVTVSQGFNKFLIGSASSASGATWTVDSGSMYFSGASLTNSGTLMLSSGGSMRRSGGVVSDDVLTNNGTVHVSSQGGGSGISGMTVVGSPGGLWVTDPDAALSFDGVAFSGVIVGAHNGATTMTGSETLAGNATFNTFAGGNPWGWSSANLDTGAFTLTNAGWMRLDTGFNKFFTGTVVNGPSALWSFSGGNSYFNPAPGGGVTSLTNQGVIDIGAAGVRRTGGAVQNAVLASSGVVRATLPNGAISDLTLSSGNGTWSSLGGASLDMSGVALSGTFVGDHAGTWTMSGPVSLAGDATFTSAVTSTNPWTWTSAAMDTGAFTFTNNGRLEMTTGFNKFLTGTAVNGATGVWSFTQGNTYLSPNAGTTTLTNSGEMTFSGNVALARNGGTPQTARFVNGGTVTAAGTGGSVQNMSVTSNSGTWRTESGSALALVDTLLAGTFNGDHAGDGQLGGTMQLTANAAFATAPGSVNPWRWTYASIDANGFTLTNSGRMEMTTGFNKFMSGAVVNAAGATWTCTQGNFYLSPGGATGVAMLTNNGTLSLENNTSIARNGGSATTAVLTNNGLLQVPGGTSGVSSVGVVNGPSGVIRIAGGASLQLPDAWAMTGGRLEGAGQFASYGTGMVNSGGTVAPGLGGTPGTLTTPARYTQTAGGTLEIAVVSNGVTQTVDKLALSSGGFNGQATIGGTLRVVLPAGTTPPPIGNMDYVIVDAPGGLGGTFAQVVEANPITGYRYAITYTPTQAIMRVVKRCSGADFAGTGADANFDGRLDNNDFVVFIDLFFAQDPQADVGSTGGVRGSDGQWNNNDFVVFIDLFFEGCH
jgi:hypothetical protein